VSDDAHSPLVTIGMPVYNNARDVQVAIKSIVAQTYANWELLILDDGSRDETVRAAAAIADPRICIIADDRNLGLAARLNQAIDLARGAFFARMDGDDISFPDRLARQVRYLLDNPSTDVVATALVTFNDTGALIGKLPLKRHHEEICSRPWSGFYLAHATWVGKIEWFRQNRYDSSLRRAEDQDLLLRSYQNSLFAAIADVCYAYRVNELTVRKALKERYFLLRSLVSHGQRRKDYAFILKAALGQFVKGAFDTIAIGTGLDYKLLRHRAQPIEQTVRVEWEKIWQVYNV
jgi:glycosyltransferase involved in cell wall biosynthesis